MSVLSPSNAAVYAQLVYDVRDASKLSDLLNLPLFSQQKSDKSVLTGATGSRLINKRDAFAVCARGTGQYKNDVFLIFRGTATKADIVTDARMGLNISETGSMVHGGFNQTFNSLASQLASFLGSQSQVNTVHCIGHSLGGAVANLAAEWVAVKFGYNTKLYTFGSPRVGVKGGFPTKLTTALSANNIHRVYHGSDPVPMVPLYPFFHAPTQGAAYYVPFGSTVINLSAHFMDNYIQSISGKNWETLYKPAPLFGSESIKNWLRSEKKESANDSTFWEKLNYAAAYILQGLLSSVAVNIMVGMTVADYLTMILMKGLKTVGEMATWTFLLIKKMMKMLGMKVAETAEELTESLVKAVLNKVTAQIYSHVKRALQNA